MIGGVNLYQYVNNNPVNYFDILGWTTGGGYSAPGDTDEFGSEGHAERQEASDNSFDHDEEEYEEALKEIEVGINQTYSALDKAVNFVKEVINLAAAFFSDGLLKGVNKPGRTGRQAKLKALAKDPKVSSADRGWILNEMRHITNKNRTSIRMPGNSRKSKGCGKVSAAFWNYP
ncbi:hypothetical protein [Desulfopila sp. IMCC35008]|uniref:hypothetical protein n=1 Tax=Desulfopila sp. IMCC35008 TaxID=2653858 RepID=UPI0013D1E236|nr:hypothetical protein [Desulfopila sp. IMCC35008]